MMESVQLFDLKKNTPFTIFEKKLVLKEYGSTDKVGTDLHTSDRGTYAQMSQEQTYISFQYWLHFTVEGQRYTFDHFVKLDDWTTPPRHYNDYYYSNDNKNHSLYHEFNKIYRWVISELYVEFTKQFPAGSWNDTFDQDCLADLQKFLNHIVQVDYYDF